MAYSNQAINSISIKKLKNINNFELLPLNEKNLTSILGVNGCGKSTILHALACCYKPPEGSHSVNHIFSHWFTPTTDSTWIGSELTLSHTYRNGKEVFTGNQTFTKQKDRWAPRYDTRAERHVELIGIDTCVPKIEQESQISFIQYETNPFITEISDQIRAVAGEILGRDYTEYNHHTVSKTKNYIGLAHNGIRYSALSMGAGEQRLFHILLKVYGAPKYSLILIDEIDLLLHTNALHLLLMHLHRRAIAKNLQIVFTTHRESVLDLQDILSIKHIHQTEAKTHWLSDAKPDTLLRLTGKPEKSIEIFVEDNVSLAIVNQVVGSLGLRRHTGIKLFGASSNCFTVAASLIVKGDIVDNIILVLDGDVYATTEEKSEMIDKALSGDGDAAKEKRKRALALVKEYQSPDKASPEHVLIDMILNLDPHELDEAEIEILEAARRSTPVVDSHDSFKKINIIL